MKAALLVCLASMALWAQAQAQESEPVAEASPTATPPAETAQTLVEHEAKFFRMGIEQGTRAAFLTFLADDAIGFEPDPQNSKKVWEAREDSPVSLMWRPVFAAISRSSDLGYTTGPSEWRRNKTDEKPFGYGQYISIWKKQKDGSWKVAVDVGGEVPGPPKTEEPLEFSLPVPPPAEPLKPGAAVRQLREAENAFMKAAKDDSTEALIDASLDNVRVFREGVYPAIGVSAAGLMLSVRRGNLIMHRLGGDISEAGDFAYSYGRYSLARAGKKERGHYLQIWRTDKAHNWKIALDFQAPLPAEEKKPES